MTTKELEKRVDIKTMYHGYTIIITYRGKEYTCKSNNTLAVDRLTDGVEYRVNTGYYTLKGALQALYDECKRANNLR